MKILIAVLALIVLYLQVRLWTGNGSFSHMHQLAEEIATQAEENTRLTERNERLYVEIDDLKTGTEAMEEHARSELGMIREGEVFYMIVDGEKKQSPEYRMPESR